jgi:hypothetical protein
VTLHPRMTEVKDLFFFKMCQKSPDRYSWAPFLIEIARRPADIIGIYSISYELA